MSDETLKIRKEGPVDWVTLNRPDSLNALNRLMVDEQLDYTQSLCAQTQDVPEGIRAFLGKRDPHDQDR